MAMDAESGYVFIERKNMTTVYEVTDILDRPQTAYDHFMNYNDEVLYLLKEGKLEGVLSIGDLERFYSQQESALKINRNYTSVKDVDFKAATDFFKRTKTINEMPVVTTGRELIGVIRKEKGNYIRKIQRDSLVDAKYHKSEWHRNELIRFINHTKAKVFLYYLELSTIGRYVGDNEKMILEKRRERTGEKYWKGLSDKEWALFFGETEYFPGVADVMRTDLGNCVSRLQKGVVVYGDLKSTFYNYKDGYRVTPGNLSDAERKVILYGSCTVAGGYCKDDQTIASYLQRYLNDNGYTFWKVLNKGICNTENFFSRMFTEELSENDIVVIWIDKGWLPDDNTDKCVFRGDLAKAFLEISPLIDNILDSYGHCNYKVNQKLAEQIYQDICASKLLDSPMQPDMPDRQRDYYIGWEIYMYFMDYFEQNDLHEEDDCVKTGAFVMACDPFTQTHRIWIEEALKQVDKLYLFLAEDPKMQFGLDDRLRMAESGVEDLSGVTVIPAGKYIFPNKLSRSIRRGKTDQEAMEYDCDIWGEAVAGQLGIKYRFVIDEVEGDAMKEYNQIVKRILPNFGIKVIEFMRENNLKGRN